MATSCSALSCALFARLLSLALLSPGTAFKESLACCDSQASPVQLGYFRNKICHRLSQKAGLVAQVHSGRLRRGCRTQRCYGTVRAPRLPAAGKSAGRPGTLPDEGPGQCKARQQDQDPGSLHTAHHLLRLLFCSYTTAGSISMCLRGL